ncbi:hypothetical protein [Methanobacterium sp.]|uniref:hypothetical protein n=1 Tax=Methanobacterium sp. TaxID=2164 RepID=UPI003C78C7CF
MENFNSRSCENIIFKNIETNYDPYVFYVCKTEKFYNREKLRFSHVYKIEAYKHFVFVSQNSKNFEGFCNRENL